jgi:hypothetical protein
VLVNLFSLSSNPLPNSSSRSLSDRSGRRRAAPCFGYYEFKKDESELKQLQNEMQATINSYLSEIAETTRDQVAVTNYGLMLETLLPNQTTIKALVELDHEALTFEKRDVGQMTTKLGLFGVVYTRGAKGFAKGC